MGSPIPYLGSKISLISKSEIRYEGILYTIDAQESIIALAKVRSFGTEDRLAEMPVPARDDVYEYIIFRGTDIKKIEVCEGPKAPVSSIHNDPAIVQASAFGSSVRQPLGPIGGGATSFPGNQQNYGQSMSQQGIPGGSFSAGPSVVPSQHVPPSSLISEMLAVSRSPTPTQMSARKSPVSDAGVQVSPPPQGRRPQRTPNQDNRIQRNDGREGGMRRNNSYQGFNNQGLYRNQYQNQYYGNANYQGRGMNRGMGGNRGRGRGRGMGRGGMMYVSNSRQREDKRMFEQEYDFEQANTKFEELRVQLASTKIGGPSHSAENGGDAAVEKERKDEETDTAAASTAAAVPSSAEGATPAQGENVTEDDSSCYDKNKSFFDTISCEAVERSQGRSQRPDWRRERKINQETFGVASARRGYYNGGRGGGNYYRGGAGGYYRGGYNQGYNTGNFSFPTYRNNYRGGRGGFNHRGGGGKPMPRNDGNQSNGKPDNQSQAVA